MEAAVMTSEMTEIARLRAELQRVEAQRDRLATICAEQADCLHEIVQNAIVLDRSALAAAGPVLRSAPAGSLRAFVRLLEDLEPGGATARAWTGQALGGELGLARATHGRLIAPLVAAGVIEPIGEPEHKAHHYRLTSPLNAHWMRAASLLTRTHRAFRETASGQSTAIAPHPNAHWMRAQLLPMRARCAQPPLNAHSARAETALVCMYDPESDPDLAERTDNGWDDAALEIFGDATRGQGLSRDLRAALMARPAADALALVYHTRAESTSRRPGGLLRRMLEQGIEPAPEYVAQAARKLSPPPAPVEKTHEIVQSVAIPAPVGLDERPGGGALTVAAIWRATLGQLRAQLNRDTYGWIATATAARYADGVLTLRAPSMVARVALEQRQELLDKVTSAIAGAPMAVRVEKEAEPVPAQ